MKELDAWFLKDKRSFPWREGITPYRVWVSEVMLQQTRAAVVGPYFKKWMSLFPSVQVLANAQVEAVIKAWEGLGYYSRARNLHRGAQQILKNFNGIIPDRYDALIEIAGLGPYTAAAILSFGFHQKIAPVDGNVLRVISRLFCLEEDVGRASVKKKINALAEGLLDDKQPWVTAEALIELGASLCTPRPKCGACPIRFQCQAALQRKADILPIKAALAPIQELIRGVAVLEAQGSVLVKKNENGIIMADLYEFPYFEGVISPRKMQSELERLVQNKAHLIGKLCQVTHSFTRYRASLAAFAYKLSERPEIAGYHWVPVEKVRLYPFSSGHKKILYKWLAQL